MLRSLILVPIAIVTTIVILIMSLLLIITVIITILTILPELSGDSVSDTIAVALFQFT